MQLARTLQAEKISFGTPSCGGSGAFTQTSHAGSPGALHRTGTSVDASGSSRIKRHPSAKVAKPPRMASAAGCSGKAARRSTSTQITGGEALYRLPWCRIEPHIHRGVEIIAWSLGRDEAPQMHRGVAGRSVSMGQMIPWHAIDCAHEALARWHTRQRAHEATPVLCPTCRTSR